MANRVTQSAREVLQEGGSPNARVTSVAREALVANGEPAVRVSQTVREVLVLAGTANARLSQIAVEALEQIGAVTAAEIRETQAVLEVVHETPPSSAVNATQAALETVAFPPNDIWQTQLCLEVLFPTYTPPTPASRRNHSFVGVWMGTGHEDNASFNF